MATNKLELVAHFAAEIVKQQIVSGVKHPSPALIKEAVVTARALVDEFDGVLAEDLEKRIVDKLGGGMKQLHSDLVAKHSALGAELHSRIDSLMKPKEPAAPANSAPSPASTTAPVEPPK